MTANREHEDYIWGTCFETQQRARSLYIIRAIAEKYGGTVELDLATGAVQIKVDPKHSEAVAMEMEAARQSLCY
jgi:hypothetical protein